jgi:uncharacterized protein YodC (DUF2158 family)
MARHLAFCQNSKQSKRNSPHLDIGKHSMNTDFRVGDVVRRKSGGQDTIIIRFEDESVDGVTKKLAVCGRFEGQNFHQETIPVEMLEFVNRWLAAGS